MTKKITILFLAICLVLGLAQTAPAFPPLVDLSIGEEFMTVSMVPGEKGWLLPAVDLVTEQGSLTLNISTDISPTDPIIAWGLTATNLGTAPLVFGFSVVTPLVLPPGTPTVVASSVVGGLTDFTGDGVAVTPVLPSGLLQDNETSHSLWSVGPAVSFPAGTPGALPYGPFAFGPEAGPVIFSLDVLSDRVFFSLSPDGDIASLTGFCSIVAIPMPASAFLFGTGLLGLLGYGWRRMKG
jgi:hypothetical protein